MRRKNRPIERGPALVRGSVITGDPAHPRTEALGIQQGRIVARGSVDEVRTVVGETAPVMDLGDSAVLPGLIDAHNHMLWTGLQRRLVDLSQARTVAETLSKVATWATDHPLALWIVSGEGWHVDDLAEKRYPTRLELDRVCPDRPVVLARGGHALVANTHALSIAGIDADTPDPAGGVIERAADGEPSGLLLEGPARDLVLRHIPSPDRNVQAMALGDIQSQYLAAGLTRVQEPGLEPDELALYQEMRETGRLQIRVTAMPLVRPGAPMCSQLDRLGGLGARTGLGDARLRLGGLKVYFDGAASFGTAYLREAYPGQPGYRGELATSAEDLKRVARFCAQNAWSLGVHVVGGGGLDLALDVFAGVDPEHSIRNLRFTLIHAYLWPSPQNMDLARQLGVIVATQPTMQERFAPLLAERFGWDRVAAATPLRAWHDAGVTLAGGSDAPLTSFAPMRGLWQATTRYCEPFGGALGPDQRLDTVHALEMYTANAALASFSEDFDGALRVGACADFTVLPVDPLRCPPDELRDLSVLLTAVDGEVLHDARQR